MAAARRRTDRWGFRGQTIQHASHDAQELETGQPRLKSRHDQVESELAG
jgi:hypothetical protein